MRNALALALVSCCCLMWPAEASANPRLLWIKVSVTNPSGEASPRFAGQYFLLETRLALEDEENRSATTETRRKIK